MEDILAFSYAMDLGCGIALPMTLRAMIELDVLNIMAEAGPDARLWPEEIASKIQTNNPNAHEVLDRMLRFLAAHKVVTCEVVVGEDGKSKRRYGLGPVCKFFTKNNDGSVAPMVLKNQHPIFVDAWVNVKHAVLDGSVPFVKTHGMTMFERADKDNIFNDIFNKAMFNQTTILMKIVLENYKGFENINVLVDVGGGHGATLGIILSKYPHIKAINFDLPHVVSQAKPIHGVEFVGGDMFVSVPSGGDAIFMKWILHDWSDAHCVKALKNCWKALPANGKVIVVELVLPETPGDGNGIKTGFLGDVMMLAYCVGGKERTEKEYRFLAKESGFSGFKTVCNLYCFAVMEFYK